MSKPSTASLSVIPVTALQRLSVPTDLTDAEAGLWRKVVDSKPADWFGEDTAPLLKEYVRAAMMCDRLDEAMRAKSGDVSELKSLLQMRDLESKRATTLATKMRLTPQSRYTPQAASTANKKASGARPWQS